MIVGIALCTFVFGVLVGICLGYFRLAQWYRQKTGRNLWREVENNDRTMD